MRTTSQHQGEIDSMEMAAGFGIVAILYFVFVAALAVLGIWIAILVVKVLQLKTTELKLRIASHGDEPPRRGHGE